MTHKQEAQELIRQVSPGAKIHDISGIICILLGNCEFLDNEDKEEQLEIDRLSWKAKVMCYKKVLRRFIVTGELYSYSERQKLYQKILRELQNENNKAH
jgi:hypothetical protein